MKLIANTLVGLVLATSAHAQSPREQLQQMVEQLQKTPNDNALREKIIKLAPTLKPAPTIPEEANRAFVKGTVFQKEAKDASSYELAISAYREALRVAPWWGDAYYNLAVAQESVGKFGEAIASLRNYLASASAGSPEAREAQNKIYALEARGEMTTKQAAEKERGMQRLQGTWVNSQDGGKFLAYWKVQTEGDTIKISADRYLSASTNTIVKVDAGSWWEYRLKAEGGELGGVYVEGTAKGVCAGRESPSRATISSDGLEMTITTTVLYTDVWRDSSGSTWSYKDCRYSPQPEKRLILRKQ